MAPLLFVVEYIHNYARDMTDNVSPSWISITTKSLCQSGHCVYCFFKDFAEIFAEQFCRPVSPPPGVEEYLIPLGRSCFCCSLDEEFSLTELRAALNVHQKKNALGEDGIPYKALSNLDVSYKTVLQQSTTSCTTFGALELYLPHELLHRLPCEETKSIWFADIESHGSDHVPTYIHIHGIASSTSVLCVEGTN